MTTKVKAIVLKSTDYKENDKILTLFSLENGKLTAVMRGVKGAKAKFKFAKEPFCFGEYIIENTKGNNIVTQAEIIDNFFEITQNLDKFYEGCAILDVANILSSESPDHTLFLNLLKALKALARENIEKYYVFDKFLLEIFKNSGYYFMTNKCSSCGYPLEEARYFNFDVGEFVCTNCKNDLCAKVSNSAFTALRLLDEMDFDRLKNVKFGGDAEIEIYNIFDKNFEWRFGKRFVQII